LTKKECSGEVRVEQEEKGDTEWETKLMSG